MSIEWEDGKCLHIAIGFGNTVRDWKEGGVVEQKRYLGVDR